jgi:hypothetical protein
LTGELDGHFALPGIPAQAMDEPSEVVDAGFETLGFHVSEYADGPLPDDGAPPLFVSPSSLDRRLDADAASDFGEQLGRFEPSGLSSSGNMKLMGP